LLTNRYVTLVYYLRIIQNLQDLACIRADDPTVNAMAYKRHRNSIWLYATTFGHCLPHSREALSYEQ